MGPCIYCTQAGGNVMEIHFGRQTPHVGGTSRLSYDVVCRAMWLCDDCHRGLEADQAHHMPSGALFFFSILTAVYGITAGMLFAGIGSLLGGEDPLAADSGFQLATMGMLALSAAVYGLRQAPLMRYRKQWAEGRPNAIWPKNTTSGFANLLKTRWPNLVGYGPLAWGAEQIQEWHAAEAPIPSTDPNGNAWQGHRPTNIVGIGVNGFYRILWTTGHVKPLTAVQQVNGLPPEDYAAGTMTEFQVFSGSAIFGATTGVLFLALPGQVLMAVGAGALVGAGSLAMARNYEAANGRVKLPF